MSLERIGYKDYRVRGEELQKLSEYKRHAFTESGVSPLGVPGDSKHLVVTDSDEHDEEGHIIEDAETRARMVDKRLLRKLPLIRSEMEPPVLYGSSEPETVIVGWGSNYGLMKEAVDALSKERSIAMLHFSEIYPFPSPQPSPARGEGAGFNYLNVLSNAKSAICIENNATGQFARLMRAETGYEFRHRINKYDGRPFLVEELIREIKLNS